VSRRQQKVASGERVPRSADAVGKSINAIAGSKQISYQILQTQRLLAPPRFDELRRACAGRQRVDPI
jgi:hypothetical protein